MAKRKLTDTFIRNYEAPESRIEIYDEVVDALAIRITHTGYKSFVYRYRYNSKVRRFTIGKYPDISLSKARDRARDLAYEVRKGHDPLEEKRKAKQESKMPLFKELAKEFKQKYLPTLRESTQKEYRRIVDNELVPAFGKFPIDEISRHEIISFLDGKAYNDNSPTMANRIRARMSKMYSFAIDRGLIEVNPVSNTSTYKSGENKRSRTYDEDEIKRLWNAFDLQDEPAQSIFKILLLTGQRKGETSRMKWANIHDGLWTIPASDAKGKRPHDVPLSPFALEIIEDMRDLNGKSDYVFQSPVIDNQPIQELKRPVEHVRTASKVEGFRPHDLRRTAATNMAKLKVDRTVLGKILNHKGLAGDSQVTAIYDRHTYMDEKRQALQIWSDHLKQILSYAAKANKTKSLKLS